MKSGQQKAWKRKLLVCAVATATSSLGQQALAVDLCSGNVNTTVSGSTAATSCVLDTTGDSLTVTSSGVLDEGVEATANGVDLNNRGRIEADLYTAVYYNTVNLDGAFSNSGTIIGDQSTTNYGAGLYVDGDVTSNINNSGSIRGRVDGDVNSPAASGIFVFGEVSGNINNSGLIAADVTWDGTAGGDADALYIVGSLSGNINNSGTIRSSITPLDDESGDGYGVYVGGAMTGNITNTGNILNSYDGFEGYDGYGVYVNGDLSTTATIDNRSLIQADVDGYWGDASYTGIYAGGNLNDSASIKNSGTIRANLFSATEDAEAYGIYASGSVNDTASIINSGLIDLNVEAPDSDATGYGIYVSSSMNDDTVLLNSGTIAIDMDGTSVDGYGIYTSSLYNNARVENSGTIRINGIAREDSAYARGIYTSSLYDDASVINSGTIDINLQSVTENTAYGIETGSVATNASVTNSGTIRLYGSDYDSSVTQYGIDTSTIDGTVTNSGSIIMDAEMFGEGYIYQYGFDVSSINGTLENSGTIKATAYTPADSVTQRGIDGGSMAGGTLINSGTISLTGVSDNDYVYQTGFDLGTIGTGSTVSNSGTITMRGTAGSSVTAYGIYTGTVSGSSVVENTGTIDQVHTAERYDVEAYGIYVDSTVADSTVSNSGTLILHGDAGSSFTAYGIRTGGISSGSVVENTGTIDIEGFAEVYGADGYGIYVSGTADASQVTNSGSITIDLENPNYSEADGYGVYVSGDLTNSTTVTNSGLIDISAKSFSENTLYGIYTGDVLSGSSVVNSGTIRLYGEDKISSNTLYGIRASGAENAGSITNSGRIELTGRPTAGIPDVATYLYGIDVSSTLTNATVENTASGVIRLDALSRGGTDASATGMDLSSLAGATSVTNAGTIWVKADSPGSSADAFGVDVGSISDTSVVTNSGTISAWARGGLYEAAAYGIESDSLSNSGAIDNSGAINVTAIGQTSATAYGIEAGSLADASTITNSGTIQVTAQNMRASSAEAFGIEADTLTGTASVSNSGTIVVRADNRGTNNNDSANARGIDLGSMAAGTSLTNTGRIETYATSADDTNSAYSVYVGGGTGGVFTNSGTLVGGISINGAQAVTNSGSITTWHHSPSNVAGDFTNATGAELAFELSDTSSYGQLAVTGTADFTNANAVEILVDPANTLADGDSFTGVISAGTLTAPSGFNLSGGNLFWDVSGTVNANSYDVDVSYNSAQSVFNSQGVDIDSSQASALDELLNGGQEGSLAQLAQALNASTGKSGLDNALDTVNPALNGAAAQATRNTSSAVTGIVSKRQSLTRGASSGDGFTDKALWVKPYFGSAEQDDQNTTEGYDVDSNGVVLGVDGALNDSWRVGVALGSGTSEVEADNADLDIDSTQLTFYGTWAMSDVTSVDMKLGYGMHDYEGTRNAGGNTANADYEGSQLLLAADLKHIMEMGENWTVTPGVGVRWSSVDVDGYTETGAGAFNLAVGDSDEDELLLTAGADFERELNENSAFTSNLRLAYDSETDQASVDTTLTSTGTTYVANGVEQDDLIYGAGIGYRYTTGSNMEFSVNYDVEMRDEFDADQVSLRFRMPF